MESYRSGVSIRASPNIDILAGNLIASSPSKTMWVGDIEILFPASLRELVFWGWSNAYLWRQMCYFVSILHLFSQSLTIVLRCVSQLPNATFQVYSVARLCPDQSSCRCFIGVGWLGLVCCTGLIRTFIAVCSASIHMFILEFEILELRQQLIIGSLKHQGVERPNLLILSSRHRFERGMTFPTLCLTPERWMVQGRSQPMVASLSSVFSFPCRWCLWGCKRNL